MVVSAKELSGAGAIHASGGAGAAALGDAGDWGWSGGGGGGGRVKVFAAASTFTGTSTAAGGSGGAKPAGENRKPGLPGAAGTVHVGRVQPASLANLLCTS